MLLVTPPGRERFSEAINKIEKIKERIDKTEQANRQNSFKLIIKNPVISVDIYQVIGEERPEIVHIFCEGNQDGSLVLKDDKGNDQPVSPEDLAEIFKSYTNYVNCVLLNSSFSLKAAKLISQHINYTIGIKESVDNEATIAFSQGFYRVLEFENSNNQDVVIQRAFDEGSRILTLKRKEQEKNPIIVLKKRSQTKYYKGLINKYQRYQTEGLSKDYSLELPEVFVPLKIIATWQNNARSELIKQVINKVNNEREYQIWDFLAATVDKQTIVVLGGPGAGKSSLLRHLTIIYASEEQHKYEPKTPELIPVLLLIRDVYQEIISKTISLVSLINEEVKQIIKENEIIQIVSRWLLEELNRKEGNKCLIMLDGLDEVADETQRRQVSVWVDEQIQAYPNTAFILTSRPGGYKAASLKNARRILEVQPFKLDQVRDFIHKWYLATEKERNPGYESSEIKKQAEQQADDLINRIRNSSPLAAMAVNPLLLTMISMVHHQLSLEKRSLPERRVDLYKEMCEVLLEKRQKEKNISDKLTGKDKQPILQVLALNLMQQTATEFKISQGISWIQEPLAARVSDEIEPEQFIEYICNVSGLLVEKELKYYQFAHLSFQEYLAATQISELNQEELLISNITKSWWAETIRLYAAQSDATGLIREVLKIQSPSVDVMALAYDCLEECVRVDENARRELLQRLEDGLESTDPERFKLAVQVSLIRRFRNFIRINEEIEIDNSYITSAEYQLFLDETCKPRQLQHWQKSNRFPSGDAKRMITSISWENRLKFCVWLGEWYRTRLGNQLGEMAVHYRLPEKEEINIHSINDDRQFSESGIRLAKFQLPSRCSELQTETLQTANKAKLKPH
ncbi:NACHT domain-containing protein [Aetokthonos hydrillicola Thurmond2011]|uniref:NACHT domain-containing protein n=1 Tax=Aetokthonos hydrillicola Thurmond2011 TaxID=2712845 RepID=A0AAP5M9L7_9CYAN|nr:NACHT domain-containing protein [Aetokthonos hydrillicola]MBO3463092.1 NACHT domain-containing protein [Aetokthonos hydrillicola CCALA 1050]MDR9900306.1 NACHT domain-containing protein [Aetokthonos hydrillicola Thurmond2011]